ncbi:MAG: hypothetical protein ACJAS9_000432 [Polaribacter sp.]|jgi:hypothetical protein
MKYLVFCCYLFSLGWSSLSFSQPWINTSELSLRADIETLADIGIITVPITTYPLMWSGIIKNIDYTDINNVPNEYKSVFWRVKNASKKAFSNKKNKQVSLTISNSEKVLRSFGDKQRGKSELRALSSQTGKNIAWNVEVSRVLDPFDNETISYEGSYVSTVLGNWVASVGQVEKWWGSSWDSSNLLSNNAKAPLGLLVNRNYTNESENEFLKWFGSWNVTAFISRLERERTVAYPIFSGVSFSTKLLSSLETSIRMTRLSAGDTPINLVNNKDKTIVGADFRWSLPYTSNIGMPTNLYAGVTDEGFERYSSIIFGISSLFLAFDNQWRTYLEYTDSTSDVQSELTYSDNYYQTGYRFKQRSIGSTYDSQSKVTTFGLIANIDRYQSIELKIQSLNINDSLVSNMTDIQNTLSFNPVKVTRIAINWDLKVNKNNQVQVELELTDKIFDSYERQNERYRAQVSWTHYFN